METRPLIQYRVTLEGSGNWVNIGCYNLQQVDPYRIIVDGATMLFNHRIQRINRI